MTEIRSFVGLAGYYRRFIEGFSKIAAPLTQLTRKDQPFAWTDRCEESFLKLKQKLTSAPVLVIPDTGKSFKVYCDASHQGLGCVLMQERRVVAYASRQVELFVLCLIDAWTCLGVIFEYEMILGEDACVEQMRNPGIFA